LTVGIQSPVVTVRNGRFRIEGIDPPMRIPDVILKCVGFIGEGTGRDSSGAVQGDLYATGFFVMIPFEEPYSRFTFAYFVTAKHVAEELRGRDVYFLVNKKGGGVTVMPPFGDSWYIHPIDSSADVAVIPVRNVGDAEITAVHVQNFGTPSVLAELDIGIGDEIFATGLFTPAAGTQRNEPIVRHGNISMMPQEQIQTELGYADVYLVEARSIGGLSGCPVFVRPTIRLPQQSSSPHTKNAFGVGHGATLLGLMHGHWDINEADLNKPYITHDRKHGVNLGVGIVVPAYKILEVLNQPELVAMRKEINENLKRKSVPGMDSARHKEESGAPFTQKDFETALKKVSRKVRPEK